MSVLEVIVAGLLAKSGATEWNDPVSRAKLIASINEIAQGIDCMALPDFFRVKTGTALTLKSSGGTAAITLASLANGNGTSAGARQAATLDLANGASSGAYPKRWRIDFDVEIAATPTAGNVVNFYGSFSNATGAGKGNTSGSDAAYTGYSNNIDAAAKQLTFLGAHICTAQATATIQKGLVGTFTATGRYLNIVVDNRSGAAFHTSDANIVITLTPLDDTIEDT